MLGTGQGGEECCGKAIGEVYPSTLGKTTLLNKWLLLLLLLLYIYIYMMWFYITHSPFFMVLGWCLIVSWDFAGAVSIFGPDALPVIHQ